MWNQAVFREAFRQLADGQSAKQIAAALDVPAGTIRYWKAGNRNWNRSAPRALCLPGECPWLPPLHWAEYAYLLGLYLGDGVIVRVNRTAQLRVFLDDRYPAIQDECAGAMAVVAPSSKVSRVQRDGCSAICSYSLHWRCIFPQHGPGMKHTRHIVLADWQQRIVDECPGRLLRGLIHSDGCRYLNVVRGHEYLTYSFSNRSADIHEIFRGAAARLGIRYTEGQFVTSIARRHDVAAMDELVGAKC